MKNERYHLDIIPAEVRYPVHAVRRPIEQAHTLYPIGEKCGVTEDEAGKKSVVYQVWAADGYVIFEFGEKIGWVAYKTEDAKEIHKRLRRAMIKSQDYMSDEIKVYAEGDRWRVGFNKDRVWLSFGEQFISEDRPGVAHLLSQLKNAVKEAGLTDYEKMGDPD